jgi:Fe2+ or Zn2+ uptake regulation protein
MSRLRKTKQYEKLQSLVKATQGFFDAEELLLKAKQEDKSIGIATVYRFLSEQVDTKNLFSYRCGTRKVYSQKRRSHCHFVDEETGKIIHFDVDSIDFLKDKIPGKISSFQIEVKGKITK